MFATYPHSGRDKQPQLWITQLPARVCRSGTVDAALPLLAGDTAHQYSTLLRPYAVILIAAFVVVNGALLVAAVAFRDRPGRVPRPAHPHHRATGIYVGVLVVIAAVLATLALRSEGRVDAAASHPAFTITVIASQWRWTFAYPDGRRSATLVAPVDRDIRFRLRSRDVLHSMYIPAERFKRYAFPDRWNTFDLQFGRLGTFLGECAQFCGWNHAYMRFTVRVLDAAGYAAWSGGGAA
jgi:cytochrome c oxidase subunit II